MLTLTSKNTNRRRVHERIRKKVLGTSERPRLNVYRSLNHIYVQVIDDLEGKTLVSANSAEGTKESRTSGGNLAAAKTVGKTIAERAKAKAAKNFARADQIREQLLEQGIVLEDTKGGVRWKRK